MKIALEANLYEYELQKRASKYSNQIQEETAEQKRQRDQKLLEEEIVDRVEAGKHVGNLGLLEYINGECRGLGYSDMNTFFGQNSTTPSFLTQMMNEPSIVPQLPMSDSVDTQILNAIEHINFQPRVSVTDIKTVHESMVKVDEWTGM